MKLTKHRKTHGVLTAVHTNVMVLWHVTQCSLVNGVSFGLWIEEDIQPRSVITYYNI